MNQIMFLTWQILFRSINAPASCCFHVEPPLLENGLGLLTASGTWYDIDVTVKNRFTI